jgi:hypothetical protein
VAKATTHKDSAVLTQTLQPVGFRRCKAQLSRVEAYATLIKIRISGGRLHWLAALLLCRKTD